MSFTHTRAGSAIILIVFLVDFLNNLELLAPVMVGGIHVYIFDVISLVLLMLSFPYWISISKKSKSELLLMGLFWVSIVAFIAGFTANSLTAGVSYRQDFTVFALIFYVTASRQRTNLLTLTWAIALYSSFGILAMLLKVFEIVQLSTYVINLGVGPAFFVEHRVIGADYSLVIAALSLILLAAAIMGYVGGNRRIWLGLAAIAALTVSIANMNRSVWLAALCGLVSLSLITKWHGSFEGRFQFVSVTVAILVCSASLVWSIESRYLSQAVSEVFREQSTANWRIIGWLGLIDKVSGLHVLWGNGYGADQTRMVFGQEISNSAHNLFVHIYFYMGLTGLFLYLLFIYEVFKGLRKVRVNVRENATKSLATSLIVLFVMLFVYHIAYSQWLLDGLVFGYSLRLLRQYDRRVCGTKAAVGRRGLQPVTGYARVSPGRRV